MSGLQSLPTKNKAGFIAAFLIMLSMAFIQCYKTTHDLHWLYEPDFDRDIAFIQGTLDGHFGKDPNYLGEYIWYNPLIYSIETVVVKISGLPINIVVARIGTYMNLLGPVAFIAMLIVLFDFKIALASLLSFLFLALGNITAWGAATYAPWMGSDCFVQFLFYLNIILCYKAFSEQKYYWFILLGIFTGLCFLGHTAPTVLIILMMISIQMGNMIKALRVGKYPLLKKYLKQGLVTFITFVLISSPFLYIILIKYHLHFLNKAILEFTSGIFSVYNYSGMFIENLSISLIVAIVGFIWFYKNFHNGLIRKIIFNWFFISLVLYIYTTSIPKLEHVFHVYFLDIVPSFHFFFYLKALQSVFFGFGFVFLFNLLFNWVESPISLKMKKWSSEVNRSRLFIFCSLLWAMVYYPVYENRQDFGQSREQSLAREKDKDKIEVYYFIVNNIPSEKVILCEFDPSIFPVMATARKMVSINATFSNPYVSYEKRESDRNNMLLYLKTGQPVSAKKLFREYQVSYVLLSNKELEKYKTNPPMLGQIIFRNTGYTIFAYNIADTS